MNNSQQPSYTIHVKQVIDSTGSMGNVIAKVKDLAKSFASCLKERCEAMGKMIGDIFIDVIAARDFSCDEEKSLETSRTFHISESEEECQAYYDYVSAIVASGGGDEPENTLEGLAVALTGKWNNTGVKNRDITVVYTDAPYKNLEDGPRDHPYYPKGIPESTNALIDYFNGAGSSCQSSADSLQASAKRLIIIAPSSWLPFYEACEQASMIETDCVGTDLTASTDIDDMMAPIIQSI